MIRLSPRAAALSWGLLAPCLAWPLESARSEPPPLPEGVRFQQMDPVNAVSLPAGDREIAVYHPAGETETKLSALLLTHARRDLAVTAAPHAKGCRLFVPEASRDLFTMPQRHWDAWWDKRFDYYEQQVTRLPVAPLAPCGFLKGGDSLELGTLRVEVLATPGVTREGLSYLVETGGKRLAFTGNLILEGGRAPDFYSFQDAIPEAKIGGYHGYGGRLGPWIESLEALAAWKPDVILPSQGPLIGNPAETIAAGIAKARAIYANYLSTNALHWYFGEERMQASADKVLGPGAAMESMPLAEHVDLPDWVRHIGTTKLLLSRDGAGFALDVGGPASLRALQEAVDNGLVTGIEGIWVTHRHNDHTQAVRDAQDAFQCPVYAIPEVAEALLEPGAHFSPGISPHAVRQVAVTQDGETMRWREYGFTFRFFPGQMLDHGGLLVAPPDGADPVFFIGDSFSPSGIDDYCLMNRNLMREDTGYLECFRIVREELPPGAWLVNQHIPHLFRFSPAELDHLEARYRERIALKADFTPWDDVNFAVDEQWAWLFPYGQEARAGDAISLTLRVHNHSTRPREVRAQAHLGDSDALAVAAPGILSLEARGSGEIAIAGKLPDHLPPGVHVVTVSLRGDDFDLPHWCEALVKVVE